MTLRTFEEMIPTNPGIIFCCCFNFSSVNLLIRWVILHPLALYSYPNILYLWLMLSNSRCLILFPFWHWKNQILRPTSRMNPISWEFYSSNVDLPFISTFPFFCFYLSNVGSFLSILENKWSKVTHLLCFWPCLGSLFMQKILLHHLSPSNPSPHPKSSFCIPHLCHLHWRSANGSNPHPLSVGLSGEDQTSFSWSSVWLLPFLDFHISFLILHLITSSERTSLISFLRKFPHILFFCHTYFVNFLLDKYMCMGIKEKKIYSLCSDSLLHKRSTKIENMPVSLTSVPRLTSISQA